MQKTLQIVAIALLALLFPIANVIAQATTPVDVNSATADQLAGLPGVGPKIAGEIIKGRPFKDINDLTSRVKGISKKNIAKLTPMVTFGAAMGAAAGAASTTKPTTTTTTTPTTTNTTTNTAKGAGVTPNKDGSCPDNAQIKGSKEGIYHMPTGDSNYKRTKAKACFATPADAEAAGYRAVKK